MHDNSALWQMPSAVPTSVFWLVLLWLKRIYLLKMNAGEQILALPGNNFLRELSKVKRLLLKAVFCRYASWDCAWIGPSVIINWLLTRSGNQNHLESIFQIYLSEPHFQKCSIQPWCTFFEKAPVDYRMYPLLRIECHMAVWTSLILYQPGVPWL